MEKRRDLSDVCYNVRTEMRMSQKRFAELIGSTQTEVSFIESGFIPKSNEKIKKIYQLEAECKRTEKEYEQRKTRCHFCM